MANYRYGPYSDGPDPLAPPYDARGALDALGDSVLEGATPADALRELARNGMPGRRGLADLLRRAHDHDVGRESLRRCRDAHAERRQCDVLRRIGHAAWPIDELRAFVAERLAAFKVPVKIWFVDEELPRNPAGKVLKRELRERLLG